jgi:hypothetical protein
MHRPSRRYRPACTCTAGASLPQAMREGRRPPAACAGAPPPRPAKHGGHCGIRVDSELQVGAQDPPQCAGAPARRRAAPGARAAGLSGGHLTLARNPRAGPPAHPAASGRGKSAVRGTSQVTGPSAFKFKFRNLNQAHCHSSLPVHTEVYRPEPFSLGPDGRGSLKIATRHQWARHSTQPQVIVLQTSVLTRWQWQAETRVGCADRCASTQTDSSRFGSKRGGRRSSCNLLCIAFLPW